MHKLIELCAPAASLLKRRLPSALILAALWTALLSVLCRKLITSYFPVSDEWPLLVDSSLDPSPRAWLTQGFSQYFITHPGLSTPVTNFTRPLFNLSYWILGHTFGVGSGRYLYFSYAAIGASAGLTYLCATERAGNSASRLELPLAATLPLMSALVPALRLLAFPCFAYDAAAACFCLLAYLFYCRDRMQWAAFWLFVAVFTKESALPAAAAFPALFLLQHRRRILIDMPKLATLLVLATPTVLWLLLRIADFSNLTGGIYLWTEGNIHLYHLFRSAMVCPFWFDFQTISGLLTPKWENLSGLLRVIANAGLVGGCAAIIGLRVRQGRALDLAELCLLFSYIFLLLVGADARFAVLLSAFLFVALVRWRQQAAPTGWIGLIIASLALGLTLNVHRFCRYYPVFQADTVRLYQVSKKFVATIKAFQPGERVVVLNDPSSLFVGLHWLTSMAGIGADVVKVSEFRWPVLYLWPTTPCRVSLAPLNEPRRLVFKQSCGVWMNNVTPALDMPARIQIQDGLSIDLVPQRETELPEDRSQLMWRSFTLTLTRGGVNLLYFDPTTDTFTRFFVP